MSNRPKLYIDGRAFEPVKHPTMKMWRAVMKFDSEDQSDKTIDEILEGYLDTLSLIYGLERTKLDGLEISEIIPSYKRAAQWLVQQVFVKLQDVPKNAPTETEP